MFARVYPRMPKEGLRIVWESVRSGELIDGDQIQTFEEMFARYIGAKHGVSVGSGRIALFLVLRALGVRENDEVIVPSYTCPVVPSVIFSLGAHPVFVDVEPHTFNLDPGLVESSITSKSKVVIATHIEGYPCDIGKITDIASRYNLKVIEDCAQSVGTEYRGRRVGTFGVASYFSFATGKQLNTLGGSIILTDDDVLADRLREEIRHYKLTSKKSIIPKLAFACLVDIILKPKIYDWIIYPVLFIGSRFGMDVITLIFEDKGDVRHSIHKYQKKYTNIQARLGIAQLRNLSKENDRRRTRAGFLDEHLLKHIERRTSPKENKSTYHYYSILTKKRKSLSNVLLKYGFDSQPTWNCACADLDMFADYKRNCPISSMLQNQVLYLPMHSRLTQADVKTLAGIINKAELGR